MDRQQRTVTTSDGVALAAEVHAASDTVEHAPTVVLAHDWGLTRACWDAVLTGLAPFGIRVVTWDQRGHGRSGLGLNRGALADLTIDDFGRDLHTVIRTLVPPSSPVVLVGHSLGGMTVLSHLAQNPQNAMARLAGVLLLATAAKDVRLRPPQQGLARLLRGGDATKQEEFPVRGNNHRDELFGDCPGSLALTAVRDQYAATDPEVLRASYRAFCRADVRNGLASLMRQPVSIVVGAKDKITPPVRSRAMTITLPNARYTAVPSAGHMLPYEAPYWITAEVRWVLSVLRQRMQTAARRRAQPSSSQSRPDQPD